MVDGVDASILSIVGRRERLTPPEWLAIDGAPRWIVAARAHDRRAMWRRGFAAGLTIGLVAILLAAGFTRWRMNRG